MIVYEVTLRVERSIEADYRRWLDAHIAQMLRLPGFVSAELFEVDAAPDAETRATWCAQYRLRDVDALADYLRDHAPRMRAEGVERFGTRFTAQRRVLRPLSSAV